MGQPRHKLAVFIGRFQPFHIGHRSIIAAAADQADSLLALIGSANRPRSWKNPFYYDERRAFLRAGIAGIALPVDTQPLNDTLYSDTAWAGNVRAAVAAHMLKTGLDPATTDIALTGFEKDKSSQYLSWFPEWSMLPAAPHIHQGKVMSATQMREALFFENGKDARFGSAHMEIVQRWMGANPETVAQIQAEARFVKAYQKRLAQAEKVLGYPIAVNTVDAVVLHSNHVLMVERRAFPGKGLWALPGGHIDQGESALMAVKRELLEETGLKTPVAALTKRQVFDHPERSEKGWVRTEAFVFELAPSAALPLVKAGSDAANARWVPVKRLVANSIFEDHFDILQALGLPKHIISDQNNVAFQ